MGVVVLVFGVACGRLSKDTPSPLTAAASGDIDSPSGSSTDDNGPVVVSPTTYPGGLLMEPPPSGYRPAIGRTAAIAAALREERDAQNPEAMLGLATGGGVPVDKDGNPIGPPTFNRRPAWLVHVSGICVQGMGGGISHPDPSLTCVGTQADILIDAETGEFLDETVTP